jgi:molybdate transport system substrate-binding protein
MKRLILIPVVALAVFAAPSARADEVTLIAPGGIRTAVEKMIPDFEKKTGHTVKATFGAGLATKAQVVKGDPFDVAIVQLPYPEVLTSGHVVVSTEKGLVSVPVGVAVKAGQRKPDISTADAVKRVMLAAKSVSYPDPASGAAAGVSFDETLKKLGITDQMRPKLKPAQGGAGAMALVASGEVELGITFVSEMTTTRGIEIVGPLPADISPVTSMSAFVTPTAKSPAAARALVQYLSGPEAAAVYRSLGMVPRR